MRAIPINRDFYFFGAFLLAMTVVAGIYQTALQMWQGFRLFQVQSFTGWLTATFVVYLIASLFLIRYHHHHRYRLPFIAIIVSNVAVLAHFIVLFTVLATGKLQAYYVPATFVLLATNLLHALSLVFSKAGEKVKLKVAGIGMFVVDSILIAILIWITLFNEQQASPKIQAAAEWLSILSGLVWVLFIAQLMEERDSLTDTLEATDSEKSTKDLYLTVSMISCLFLLILGYQITRQSYFQTHASPVARKYAMLFDAGTFTNSQNETLQYRLLKPMDYDAGKKYPLVVCLHGGAGWGTDNMKQFDGSLAAQMLSEFPMREKHPAFVFVPQLPPMKGWGGISRYPTTDSLVFDAIANLEQEFSIDEKRRYVIGSSLGGYGTWHFISTRPDMFAAAIPISGEGNPQYAQSIVDIPVWAFHGLTDRNVPVSGSQLIIQAVKDAGGTPRYTEYPDRGHDIWKQVRETPGLLDWMFEQRRE